MLRLTSLFLSFFIGLVAYASEPLWMTNPAISPDGEEIAFSYKGNIFIVNAAGGKAQLLTSNSAIDRNPVWSKDGKQIAFTSERYGNPDIFIMDSDGQNKRRLTFHSHSDNPSDFDEEGNVIFSSVRQDDVNNLQFPTGLFSELYITQNGSTPKQWLTTSAINARLKGKTLLFEDVKGYESPLRKHHTSSVARDIWKFDTETKTFTKLTNFKGEDRNPLFGGSNEWIYYLSEKSGSFNIFKMDFEGNNVQQLTSFDKHPIRSLSISNSNLLCFVYNGQIYTLKEGEESKKVPIQIWDDLDNEYEFKNVSSEISGYSINPNNKEIAFIARGEVFVTDQESKLTKQITNTPEQERSVHFNPKGGALVYASERNGSWNIYQSKLKFKDELYFYGATLIDEEPLVETDQETFQPLYSPDGKKIAFLENRTTIKVIDVKSKQTKVLVPAINNYSYADGDIEYSWSSDSKWLTFTFLREKQWIDQIGMVEIDGDGAIIDLTKSGYYNWNPKWVANGKMIAFQSNRHGMKNHASHGSEGDVYAFLMNQKAYDRYKLSKEEYTLLKEREKEQEKEEEETEENKKKDKEEDKKEDKKEPLQIELENLKDRKVKLTIHSSRMSDYIVNKDGDKLFYLANFEGKFNLWQTDLRTKETKILVSLKAKRAGNLQLDKDSKNLFVLADGKIKKIEIDKSKAKGIELNAQMKWFPAKEREYMFEHVWRQVREKFYKKDLHGVDWNYYKDNYAKFLPHINNNQDFALMLSELLGELNASHTGAYYRSQKSIDKTPYLGLFYKITDNGLKVTEVIPKGPFDNDLSKVKKGVILKSINGVELNKETNIFELLNNTEGKFVVCSFSNSQLESWNETIKPISYGTYRNLLYDRWVQKNKEIVEEASNGELGYVHVRGMNDASFRVIFDEALGEYHNKKALIVDTRFNGGGWLHDDLITFLSGKPYVKFFPREQDLGTEPARKWSKPSIVLMSESNYSDAHFFPVAYKANNVGETVGMPVPGTTTAVWWERLLDKSIVFGIPQVGVVDNEGNYLENLQLEPDYRVPQNYTDISKGLDKQLLKAVEVLMK